MKMAVLLLALLVAVGSTGACTTELSDRAFSSDVQRQDDIRARTADFSRAIVDASRNGWSPESAARVADFYAVDTVVFPPRGEPLRGRPALESHWQRSPDKRILSHAAIAERIDVSDNLATEWGTLTITSQQGAATSVQSTETYISIWTRQDGVWRKQMDSWW